MMLTTKYGTLAKIFIKLDERLNMDRNIRKMGLSYAWTRIVLLEMMAMGFITMQKRGREFKIKLTPKGKEARTLFKGINRLLMEDG